jgi:hyperosmotically inducible periplasmic protein
MGLAPRDYELRNDGRAEVTVMRKPMSVMAVLIVLLLGAGCQSMTGESAGRNIDDATITTEVKAKLAAEKASNLTRVSVTTANGSVSLAGIVATPADRVRAEQITRSIKGVKTVANNLQIEKP